ncbi:hypothetical protein HAV_00264 [Candidatus Hepatincola sp. Av]
MEISKKITRLFISTGYYHNLIIATLIEQISLPNVMYEDYLILSSIRQDLEKNLQMVKLLGCNFTHTYSLSKKQKPADMLAEKCQGLIFDEIYAEPFTYSSSYFKKYSNTNTKYYGVHEGLMSYVPPLHNTKSIFVTQYLLFPELCIYNTKVVSINREILKKNLSKISVKLKTKYDEKNILFIAGTDKLTKEGIKQLINYFNLLTDKGYTIYIKDHPRIQVGWKNISSRCKNPEKIIPISEDIILAEQILPIIKPKMIVGFKSTSLLAGYYFYNIPTFCIWQNTKSLTYKFISVERIMYAIPHLEDFLNQNKYNALEYCDNYSFFYLSTFQNLLIKETGYLPIKLQIYLKLFFKTTIIKSLRSFVKIIYYLIRYKYLP